MVYNKLFVLATSLYSTLMALDLIVMMSFCLPCLCINYYFFRQNNAFQVTKEQSRILVSVKSGLSSLFHFFVACIYMDLFAV